MKWEEELGRMLCVQAMQINLIPIHSIAKESPPLNSKGSRK